MDTPGGLKGIDNEVAQGVFRSYLHKGAHSMVMPQGFDILLPMDRILQVIQQDLPDGPGVIRVRKPRGIGDHRDLGRMEFEARQELGHFLPDHGHDGGMEGHAHPQLGIPVAFLVQFGLEGQDFIGAAAQDHLPG